MDEPRLFFGVGSGRCGTMTLANLLNAEPGVVAMHEGKFRVFEEAGQQVLPFLTLQNYQAYRNPGSAISLFEKTRSGMEQIGRDHGALYFGDVAYNYAPFLGAIINRFPQAKLIFIYRDGRDFVRSAYTNSLPDPTPVGWPGADRTLSKVERFVGLGRLRPVSVDPVNLEWDELSPVAKNAWLWAETNRIILRGLKRWPRDQVFHIRFETFFADLKGNYQALRAFMGFDWQMPADFSRFFSRKINKRKEKILSHWSAWDDATKEDFNRFGADVMETLGYY